MDKKDFLASSLLKRYLLGLTSPEENQQIEQLILSFPDLEQEIATMRRSLSVYAQEQTEKDLQKVITPAKAIPPKATTVQKTNRGNIWVIALAAVLGIWCIGQQWHIQKINTQNLHLQSDFARLEERCAQNQQHQAAIAQQYAFLCDSHTHPVFLQGTKLAPEAQPVVYWNAQQHEALCNTSSLPKPPHGKQYQIWADVAGKMINMGVLANNTHDLQPVHFIEKAESLNITLEPIGGSDHPTVALLYANGLNQAF